MENELVRYSRAGDIFHYRWAARRCLKLIHPKSLLRQIVIEGSRENDMAGEYVIDVAEYSEKLIDKSLVIDYYQLKHTTVQKEIPFNLSDLKDTIVGFSRRYIDYKNKKHTKSKVTFTIVTNRPINNNFKDSIVKIGNREKINLKFKKI